MRSLCPRLSYTYLITHYYSLLLSFLSSSSNLTRSFRSISSSLVIFISISKGGCDELVHHLETVVGAQPNCLESQRLDFFFSASITFRRLRSLLLAIVVIRIFATKLHNLCEKKETYPIKNAKRRDFSEFHSFYVQKIDWLTRKILRYLKKIVKLRRNWNKICIFATENTNYVI